jgi:tetratricopeptide (TPR) repeat protein
VIEALIGQQSENQELIRMRSGLLTDLADVLTYQGKYYQAQKAYEERLEVAKQQNDRRGKAVVRWHIGWLAQKIHDHEEAQSQYTAALEIFHTIGELSAEADPGGTEKV